MTVLDLILALQKEDPKLEVMFDITKEGAELSSMVSVDHAELADIEGDKIFLLETNCPDEEPNLN